MVVGAATSHHKAYHTVVYKKAPAAKTVLFCVLKYIHMTSADRFNDWYNDEHTSSPDLDEDANELDIDSTYNDIDYN